jgi:hypothetical protein
VKEEAPSKGLQRAILLGLISSILDKQEDEELTLRNVKIAITNCFVTMIDNEHMIGDMVEVDVLKKVMTFIEQEELVQAFTKD